MKTKFVMTLLLSLSLFKSFSLPVAGVVFTSISFDWKKLFGTFLQPCRDDISRLNAGSCAANAWRPTVRPAERDASDDGCVVIS